MSSYGEVLITPLELINNKILEKEIVLNKKKQVLLHGKIVNCERKPVEGAIILISALKIDGQQRHYCEVGFSVTNENGEYAIALLVDKNIDYKLEVFEPMIDSDSECCFNY